VQTPGGDERLSKLLEELEKLRNLLLAYRLLHFNEKIPDIKLNIKGREKQLFKPIVRVFQGTETLDSLLPVITNYVKQKRESNDASLNAFLYTTAVNVIGELKTTTIASTEFWNRIVKDLEGKEVSGRSLSVETTEFGIISQKEIIQTLEHTFGVKKKRTESVRYLVFNPSKLQQLGKVYNLSIQVEIVNEKEKETNSEEGMTDMTDIGTGEQKKIPIEETNHEGAENENTPIDTQNDQGNNLQLSPNVSDVSDVSFFKCYYCEKEGNNFQVDDEKKYLEHGVSRHYQRPMFPNMTDIEVYGLTPQDREWEI
jgi:hypothetical protein